MPPRSHAALPIRYTFRSMRYGPKLTPCREYDSRKKAAAARFTATRQPRAQRAVGRLKGGGNAGDGGTRKLGDAGVVPPRDHVVALGERRGG